MRANERRPLRSGHRLSLPRLGLGTAPLGGMYRPVADEDATATVDAAFRLGLTYLDTAPQYGWGLAETRLGRALAHRSRESFVLSTKVGRLVEPVAEREPGDIFLGAPPGRGRFDFSATGLAASLEASLARLRLERVDIVYVHDPDDHMPAARDEAVPALLELREKGVVSAVGAGMNHAAPLAALVRAHDLDVVLCAGRYSLLDQSAARDLLPLCAARDVAVVVGGVFNSGLLAAPGPGATYDYAPAPEDLLARAQRMAELSAEAGTDLKAAALQFPFGHPAVRTVVVGARTPAELEENRRLLETPVPASLWEAFRREGLLGADVPVPTEP